MAHLLGLSPYTVQDHFRAIFEKTGARTRGELVGQVFLEHYIPRWEELDDAPAGWFATASSAPLGNDSRDGLDRELAAKSSGRG
jgi:hypothetical protein